VHYRTLHFIILLLLLLYPTDVFSLEVGDLAKDFALRDAKKNIVTLGDMVSSNDITILELLSVYCHACAEKIPRINDIQKKFEPRGVKIVAVAVGNDQTEVDTFLQKFKPSYTVYADPGKTTFHLYNIQSVPQFFFIDNTGVITYKGSSKNIKIFEKNINAQLQKGGMELYAGDTAPGFSLESINGDVVNVAFGNARANTIIGFIDSFDDEADRTAHMLRTLCAEYNHAGMRVFAVATADVAENIKKSFKDNQDELPFLIDNDRTVFSQYNVSDSAEIIVINKKGRIINRSSNTTYNELVAFLGKSAAHTPQETAAKDIDMLNSLLPDIHEMEPISLDKDHIYAGTDTRGEKYYIRIVKRNILCDVCTDVYFVHTIDKSGFYRHIVLVNPFELYGTPIDAADFIKQFIGKSFHKLFMANGNVDMITGATKTCLKFIEAFNENEDVFGKFIDDPEFDATFRKKLCYEAQAEIELALQLYLGEHQSKIEDINVADLAPYCTAGKLPKCRSGGGYQIIIFNGIPRIMCTVHGLDPESATFH